MTLQWTLVAYFLYGEIGLVALLCIPKISARRWNRIFNSSLLNWYATFYFFAFVAVLVLFFADAINQIQKHPGREAMEGKTGPTHLHEQTLDSIIRFRAQRNFYISGMALLLIVVLQRMITSLCREARREASHEAAIKQATSASDQAQKLMEEDEKLRADELEKEEGKKGGETEDVEKDEIDGEKLRNELERLKEKNATLKSDAEASRKQAKGVSTEYDRLMSEHSILQEKLQDVEGNEESKKDQ
ncbi:B-cell receptor-associated protein 31-like isoform X2 [Oscarella lobularis]|uniref:B-cell receptor-associated protein 31-like isoform X2 n=1 Tax=Oscarella lobularis TaxID=121494 RepID=UPI003313550A